MKKCQHHDGAIIKIGEHEVDPCLYKEVAVHHHCTVIVNQCVRCGHIELEWIPEEGYWVENEQED